MLETSKDWAPDNLLMFTTSAPDICTRSLNNGDYMRGVFLLTELTCSSLFVLKDSV